MSFKAPVQPYNVADPNAVCLGASCLDLLLIEIVPMTFRMAEKHGQGSNRVRGSSDEDEQHEATSKRLEAIGYRVGEGIAER